MSDSFIFDHYEVLQKPNGDPHELGRGAMGITYKAFDTSLQIIVALKVINATYLHSEIARQRFIREARSAAKLRHRNVASVFHLGISGENWFYAMEFIDGETLEALIKRQGPIPPALALSITAQVSRALNAASQHDLVHRDIKPANLMLVQEDDVLVAKVIDFGLAKTFTTSDQEASPTLTVGGFVGTPHFASPEQLEDQDTDLRSDIYSLGVTLWYMLAGHTPFSGSIAQVMVQHLSKPPPFEEFPDLPPPVSTLLRKMLEKNPADRFQTPADLRSATEFPLHLVSLSQTLPTQSLTPSENPQEDPQNFSTLAETTSLPVLPNLKVGSLLADRYQLLEALHPFHQCQNFRALDNQKNCQVRILLLHPGFSNQDSPLSLDQTVASLKKIHHPNLLAINSFESAGPSSFLVFEWTNGFSLLELLRTRHSLSESESLLLLTQIAQGIDHLITLDLPALHLSLHLTLLHFPTTTETHQLRSSPLATWPEFIVKIDPLIPSSTPNLPSDQTVVSTHNHSSHSPVTTRTRLIQELANLAYELLGGSPPPSTSTLYTPISALSEPGNDTLRNALNPTISFPSALDFCNALHPTPTSPTHSAPTPFPSQKSPTSPLSPTPTNRRLLPFAIAAFLLLGFVGYFSSTQLSPRQSSPPEITDPLPSEPPADPPQNPSLPTLPPPTIPPITRDLLKAQTAEAEKIDPTDAPAAITAWLAIARDFPDSGVGKNHLESLFDQLRRRPKPLSNSEFNSLRSLITEAADRKILSATLLLADQLRLTEPLAAFHWYTAATAMGNIPSFAVLGFITERGFPGKKPDPEQAVKFFQIGADQGDPSATFGLGRSYITGRGVPAKNLPLGVKLIQQASDAGDTRATDLLGDCYAHATGVPLNFDEAFRLFTQAADHGNPASIGNLGVLYMTGRGVPAPNPKKAAELFEKGARADDPPSMFNFAQCLNEGIGTAKNELESKIWFRRSAEAGDERAAAWCLKNHLPFTLK